MHGDLQGIGQRDGSKGWREDRGLFSGIGQNTAVREWPGIPNTPNSMRERER